MDFSNKKRIFATLIFGTFYPKIANIIENRTKFCRNMNYFEMMPFRKKWPIFRKLAEISDLTKLSPEEQELYDEDIKIMRDLYATQEFEEEASSSRHGIIA